MRPSFDTLESRESPGYAWGPSVTWSVVPDGTAWLGGRSTLRADLAARRPDWLDQIRAALAEWGRDLGLMFVEVADDGRPIGSESPVLRIGGNREDSNVLARAYFPAPAHGSDISVNSAHDWSKDGFDLRSVILHEVGHAVADLRDGESPIMSPSYRGPANLTPRDVDAALASVVVDRGPAAILSKFGERT